MSHVAADALVAEGDVLLREQRFAEAATRYARAVAMFPDHALGWKGLGHAHMCLGQPHEATHAFDRAIGLGPGSATALWGGALAHADVGNKVVAQNYLRRALALQPTWTTMAEGVPLLAPLLQLSTRAADCLHRAFGAFGQQPYRYAGDPARAIDVGRIAGRPVEAQYTFVTIGLSNTVWLEPERPRVELVMASLLDSDVCGKILANLAFHVADARLFPEPGIVVREVVGSLAVGALSQRLPHAYVIAPRGFGLHLPLDVGPPAITLAQVVPISEAEFATWRQLGPHGFERALLERRIELADLGRLR